MIGLWAAVALFGGAVFLGIDALYPSPPEAVRRRSWKPLGRLRRILIADLQMPPHLVLVLSGGGAEDVNPGGTELRISY